MTDLKEQVGKLSFDGFNRNEFSYHFLTWRISYLHASAWFHTSFFS